MSKLAIVALVFVSLLSVAISLNGAIKVAGQGMNLLKPIFMAEAKLQAVVLGAIGKVDVDDVRSEISAQTGKGAVVYTYGLSPFSSEAISVLKATGASIEIRELGAEWFLLGPRQSVIRQELAEMTGQSSLPHIFIGGQHVGGLSTGPSGGLAGLVESGGLEAALKKADAFPRASKAKQQFKLELPKFDFGKKK